MGAGAGGGFRSVNSESKRQSCGVGRRGADQSEFGATLVVTFGVSQTLTPYIHRYKDVFFTAASSRKTVEPVTSLTAAFLIAPWERELALLIK